MTQLTEEQHRLTKSPPERLWLIPTTTGWLHEFDTPYAGSDGVEYVRRYSNVTEVLAEIRQRQEERRARCELTVKGTDIPLPQSIPDIDILLSLLDSDSQAAGAGDVNVLIQQWIATLQTESRVTEEDAEDLMFRIIAFNAHAATAMRDKCVEKVQALCLRFQQAADSSPLPNDLTASRDRAAAAALTRAASELKSITLVAAGGGGNP